MAWKCAWHNISIFKLDIAECQYVFYCPCSFSSDVVCTNSNSRTFFAPSSTYIDTLFFPNILVYWRYSFLRIIPLRSHDWTMCLEHEMIDMKNHQVPTNNRN